MRICDICGSKHTSYNTTAVTGNNTYKELELCLSCFNELQKREHYHRIQAYEETVQAMTGKIPRKAHWWDMFSL